MKYVSLLLRFFAMATSAYAQDCSSATMTGSIKDTCLCGVRL